MDCKQKIRFIIKGLLVLLLLSACSEEVTTSAKIEPKSLAILGVNDDTIYYDTQVELKFGASGGDGVYRYRYIQNPDLEDRDDDFRFNPLELEVEVHDTAKPSFSLKGIIKPEPGVSVDELRTGTLYYQIEITDGLDTRVQTFKFDLQVNSVFIQRTALDAVEGFVSNAEATRLLGFKENGSTEACDDIGTLTYEQKTLPNGLTVYPFVINAVLQAPSVQTVEVFYRITSNYREDLPERHENNVGLARPGVDFIAEERSFILKPGQIACLAYVNFLDDGIIEGAEELSISFYETKGGLVTTLTGKNTITLGDSETLPAYSTKQIIQNEGEKVVGSFSLSAPQILPVSINVKIDLDNTTASAEDYVLEPDNGVVTIAAGELEASYTVSLLLNKEPLGSESDIDEVITIVTDIDELVEEDPFEITINKWPLAPENEIVAMSTNRREARAFDVAESGTVSVLLEGYSAFNEEQAVVIARRRDGTKKKLINSESGELIIAKQGVLVKPVEIGTLVSGNETYMAVIANVDGLFTGSHRGQGDFIVVVYQLNRDDESPNFGYYNLLSVKQYGTEGEDVVLGAEFDDSGEVYVFGQTDGNEFDGVASGGANKGGNDGFVYNIDIINNTLISSWDAPRFIGSEDQDQVLALGIGGADFTVLTETDSTDLDIFALKINSQTGLDVDDIDPAIISSPVNDFGTGIKYDHDNSGFYVMVDSEAKLPETGPTASLSQDINVLLFNSAGERTNADVSKVISTNKADFSTDMELLAEDDRLVVGGYTEGVFEGNTKISDLDTTDAFISVFTTTNLEVDFEGRTLQFGTKGNDKVIEIENVNDYKFLALWSEDYTSGDGTLTYRVSAFSAKGEMLSAQLE